MITDTFEIFCSHKDIQTDACIRLSVIQDLGQLFLNIIEGIVHLIIIVNNLSAKLKITLYKGIDAFCNHPDSILCHLPDINDISGNCFVLDMLGKIRNICCLITDAFHIGDHLQRCGNGSQISGYRMLMKKKLHAEIFDLSFLCIDLFFRFKNLANESHPAFALNSFGRK